MLTNQVAIPDPAIQPNPNSTNPYHVGNSGKSESVVIINQTGVPQRLSHSSVFFNSGWFYGIKAVSPAGGGTMNGAVIFIGKTAQTLVNPIQPGGLLQLQVAPGLALDLSEVWVIGTSGDGVFYSLV